MVAPEKPGQPYLEYPPAMKAVDYPAFGTTSGQLLQAVAEALLVLFRAEEWKVYLFQNYLLSMSVADRRKSGTIFALALQAVAEAWATWCLAETGKAGRSPQCHL